MFQWIVYLLLIKSWTAHGWQDDDDDPTRIVGGRPSYLTQRPYQVSLTFTDGINNYLCGGSLISDRYVLTAAHCVDNKLSVDLRAGSIYYNRGGFTASAFRFAFTPHPRHIAGLFDYDIAIIDFGKSAIPLNNDTIKAVQLAEEGNEVPDGTLTTVSGWGTTREGGKTSSVLLEVDVPIVSRENCSRVYSQLTPRMICAGYEEGGKDSCQGDSGGPLVLTSNSVQVGIVSFGEGCARPDRPGVYTNIPALRSWINSVIN